METNHRMTNRVKSGFQGTFLFWLIIALVVLAVVGMVAYQFSQMGGGPDPSKFPKAVDTLVINPQPVDVTYEAQGTVEARNRIDLNVEVAGVVSTIEVIEGAPVRRGQVLLRLKAGRQSAQQQAAMAGRNSALALVESRKAEIAQAKANVAAAQAAEELAESEYQRYDSLYREQFVSALERDQKRLTFKTETARREAAEDTLEQAQAQEKQARAQLGEASAQERFNQVAVGESIIRAPFDGVVGEKYVDLGDYIIPGEKVLTLVDNHELNIAFKVPERLIGQLKTGLPIRAFHNEQAVQTQQKSLQGTVWFISPTVDSDTRSVTLKARVLQGDDNLNSRLILRDGQFAHVALTLLTKPDGLLLPEEALVPQGEKFFVYLSRDKKAVFREVKLGERQPGWVEITEGLKSGDEVVTSGLQKLFEGAILIKKEDEPAPATHGRQPSARVNDGA